MRLKYFVVTEKECIGITSGSPSLKQTQHFQSCEYIVTFDYIQLYAKPGYAIVELTSSVPIPVTGTFSSKSDPGFKVKTELQF